MKKIFILLLTALSPVLLADGWNLRLGIVSFPNANNLVGLEFSRLTDLDDSWDLSWGGVLRTDFNRAIAPGVISRLRYWIAESFAAGASTELGYLFGVTTGAYFFAGPVMALRATPLLIQWEPGFIFFGGLTQFQPLRLMFGFEF